MAIENIWKARLVHHGNVSYKARSFVSLTIYYHNTMHTGHTCGGDERLARI